MNLARLGTFLSGVRSRAGRPGAVWLATFAVFTYGYVTLDFPQVYTAQPVAHGDGVYYYAWARSLAFDGDIDFANDYPLVGNRWMGRDPKTGHWVNTLPMGTGLLRVPQALLGRAIFPVARRLELTAEPNNGAGPFFQRFVNYVSVLLGFTAVILGARLAVRYVSPWIALLGGLGILLATPITWYMLYQACHSHPADAAVTAIFVYFWWTTYGRATKRRWFGLGLLLGLASLVRPQNVAHGILPFLEWTLASVGLVRAAADSRKRWRALGSHIVRALLLGAGLVLAFSPQMLAWRYLFGAYLTIPQGKDYMLWNASRYGAHLFGGRFGLFAWHPLAYLAVLGLFLPFFRRGTDARLRRLVAFSLVAFALQTFVNGAPVDWWGHWSFGGRRAVGSTVYLCVGLAFSLDFLRVLLERHGRWLLRATPAVLVAVFGLLNVSLMDDYLYSRVRHEDAQPMKPVWKMSINKLVDRVYAVTGNWGSIPVNWLFAWKAGVSPERFDVAGSVDIDPLASGPATLSFASDDHAMGGFGPPTSHQSRPCRWLDQKAGTWVFALRRPMALRGAIDLVGAQEGMGLTMRVGKHPIMHSTLSKTWTRYEFTIPEQLTSAGVVYVNVELTVAVHEDRPPEGPASVAFGSVTLAKDTAAPPVR